MRQVVGADGSAGVQPEADEQAGGLESIGQARALLGQEELVLAALGHRAPAIDVAVRPPEP